MPGRRNLFFASAATWPRSDMAVTYDDFEFGFSWLPDEALNRTSHALDTGDGVWLIDPVDVPEAIDRAAALGRPPACCSCSTATSATAPRSRAARRPPPAPARRGSGQPVHGRVRGRHPALARDRALVARAPGARRRGADRQQQVPRARRRVRRHAPVLRLAAPGALRGYEPEHLLVGHGRGVHGPAAAAALADAYARARKDLPRLALRLPADGEGGAGRRAGRRRRRAARW